MDDVSPGSGDADSGRAESPPPTAGKALGKRPVVAEPPKKKRKLTNQGPLSIRTAVSRRPDDDEAPVLPRPSTEAPLRSPHTEAGAKEAEEVSEQQARSAAEQQTGTIPEQQAGTVPEQQAGTVPEQQAEVVHGAAMQQQAEEVSGQRADEVPEQRAEEVSEPRAVQRSATEVVGPLPQSKASDPAAAAGSSGLRRRFKFAIRQTKPYVILASNLFSF